MDKKNTTIKERILQIAKNKGFSYEKFLSGLSLNYANFKGKQKLTGINSNSIGRIVSKYPETNLRWLITGEGEMFLSSINMGNNIGDGSEKNDREILFEVLKENRELNNENRTLIKSIDSLKKYGTQIF